jgi:hypothetical protein
MFKTNQLKESMKKINIQFYFKDSFKRVPPKYFKTDDMKTAI